MTQNKPDLSFRGATNSGENANRKALRSIRVRTFGEDVQKSANGITEGGGTPTESQALPEEPFHALSHKGLVVEPPFDMLTLAMLPEHSSELNQCVEAMETNVDATGHRFVTRIRLDKLTLEEQEAAKKDPDAIAAHIEKVRLTNFFEYATDESFTSFRRKLRRDLETTGNAYYEVLRDSKGNIQGFTHLPSYQMRIGKLDSEARLVDRKILELQEDGSVKVKTQKIWKKFRRYVQSRAITRHNHTTVQGDKVRWYKDFGDTRNVSFRDGRVEGDSTLDGQKIPKNELANEVLRMRLYSPRSVYGLPRYIGNLLSIFGDRASEEINYITFRNNNIPSMVMLVSNGQLTDGSLQRIESFVESQIQGSDNYSKFLLIEAEPYDGEGEDGGQVKLDTKPLVDNQHTDALFQNYSKNNQDKIRRAFRLPPIFVGRSDDYTRATAEASRRLADEQVFQPERDEFDFIMNRMIFPEMGIRFHKFKSNSPNTTDNEQLVKILAGAEKTGGMTPEIARVLLEDILGIDLPPFPQDFNSKVPFSQTMAEAVKNNADPAEPGQQVTALKTLETIEKLTGGTVSDESDMEERLVAVTKQLVKLKRSAERAWESPHDIPGDD